MEYGPDVGNASALVVAIENYDHYPRLEKQAAAASDLAEALAAGGIVNAFPNALKGGTSQALASSVVSWLEGAGKDDRLLLYWSGHGKREADGLYLITQESPTRNLNSTNAVEPNLLAKSAANSKAGKILVVLDACFSGDALGDVIGTVSRVIGDQPPDLMQRRGVAILASAHALQKAQEGIISGLLKQALTSSLARRRWSDEDRFIDADRLFASLYDELETQALDQRIVPAAFGSTIELLPNPRYRPGLVAEIVEDRRWRLARSGGAEHFDLAARGIEVGERGWYFVGRTKLLRTLVDWLTTAEHGVRIVTGPPGAGKSAVMGRLATLSDAEYRKAALEAGAMAPEGTIPLEHIIDVAIHAKGKTLDDCARVLAQAFGIAIVKEITFDTSDLVIAIDRIGRRVTIMVDALDEAASGQGGVIASRLIVPLGRLARVRVLVGSRRSVDGAVIPQGEERHGRLRAVFGADAIIDDLEDETETHEDIADYVRSRLLTSAKHRTNLTGISAVADRVAHRAVGVFLYARIVSRTVQELDRLDGELPSTALEAFAHDLRARFGAEQQRVDDLLAALAWAEGKGLTRRVWPLVATALAAQVRSYDDDDVTWVLEHAGWHIIEAGEDGQAVYRLGHQALTDHYRGRGNISETQDRIVAALSDGTAGAAWFDRDRYLWRHIADHAAQADRLDVLIRDAGYLAVADPARLVTVLPVIRGEEARRFADIYNRVADRLIDQPPLERLPLIHMTALMEAPDLARLLQPPVPTRWLCRWARARPSTPHRIIGKHSGVTSVVFAIIDDRAVVVSGSGDRTIRLWDVRTGEAIGKPLEGHTDGVNAVALGAVDGRAVLVSGSSDCTIRLWDARTGEAIGKPFEGHAEPVNAVAIGAVAGGAVVTSGGDDRTVRLWDARTGEAMGKPIEGHKRPVSAIALGAVDGRAVVISGSGDETICLWDAHTGEAIGKPLKGVRGRVTNIALAAVDGRTVVVSDAILPLDVRAWLDGRVVVVWDRTIRSWMIRLLGVLTGKQIVKPLGGYSNFFFKAEFGTLDGRPVAVSGDWDGTVRLWDPCTGEAIADPLARHTAWVTVVGLGAVDGRGVVISGGNDRTIRLWDGRTGKTIGEPLEGHTEAISALALGTVDGRVVVVSGSYDGTVRLWDARTNLGLFTVSVGTGVTSVSCQPGVGVIVGLRAGILALEVRPNGETK